MYHNHTILKFSSNQNPKKSVIWVWTLEKHVTSSPLDKIHKITPLNFFPFVFQSEFEFQRKERNKNFEVPFYLFIYFFTISSPFTAIPSSFPKTQILLHPKHETLLAIFHTIRFLRSLLLSVFSLHYVQNTFCICVIDLPCWGNAFEIYIYGIWKIARSFGSDQCRRLCGGSFPFLFSYGYPLLGCLQLMISIKREWSPIYCVFIICFFIEFENRKVHENIEMWVNAYEIYF